MEGPAVLSPSQRMLSESVALPFVIPSEAEGSAVLQARLGNVFDRVLIQVEVKVCRAYGARRMLGIDPPALPGWADVWAVGPTGLEAQAASSIGISRTSLQNCRSLGCARDDKGEGDVSRRSGC